MLFLIISTQTFVRLRDENLGEKIFHSLLILINEKFWSQICVVIGCKIFYGFL